MKRSKINLVLTLFVTLVLMVCVIIYTSRLFYRISVTNIYEAGTDKITGVAANLENYLDTAKSVLWVTADTVDDMLENGDSTDRILEYLTKESKNQEEQFDENYTGIYGYIQGAYLDGVGWEPPEGYEPTKRDWYFSAKEAKGETTIVTPYVDAQTGSVIISISKLLKNGVDVLSLDLTMNQIQAVVKDVQLKDKGYGFVLDKDGIIVAHHDVEMNGKIYADDTEHERVVKEVKKVKNGKFSASINGKKCTVFSSQIMEQWYMVIVVSDKELFSDVWSQLFVNVSIFLIVFLLIVFFYLVAYRNEQRNSKRMEDLKISEQKKEYEAKVLKLEKSAADAANKAKSSFLAEMSHEIRTPINAILGMNEMILREAEDENIIEYSGNVQSAGRTLLSIINSILDFSKIEDGKMEIVPVRYDVASVIHDLVNSILERVKAKGLEFRVDIDETIPSVLYGDDVRISQIIMNLLTNAVKYTNEGTVFFSVKADGREAGDIFLLVEVRDTGIGIRKEDMEKLFESFGRLEEKRNRHIEGTGLGMAIVTKLLAMMDSELKVDSVYGEGSTFSFRLRQPVVEEEPIGNYVKRLETSTKEDRGGEYLFAPDAKILVTDDNEMNRKVAFNLMKRNGIKPELLASGEETIERVREKTYDIIFLDHMMPKMDGIETLERLKAENLIRPGTTVIALTANAVVGARERYLEAGFHDYLSKPMEVSELEEKLAKYLPAEKISYRREEKEAKKEQKPSEKGKIFEFLPEAEFSPEDSAEEKEGGTKYSDDLFEKLESMGIRTEEGMQYCAEDKDFYLDMLHEYVRTHKERADELTECYEEKSWRIYETAIHALKSTSKTIGAQELFEQARALEQAAEDGDIGFLEQNHGAFLEKYREMAEKLKAIL